MIAIFETGKNLLINCVIIVSLFGIAVGGFPKLKMNRTTIVFAGATLLIVLGNISVAEAMAAIDMETLVLIFAMMVVTANLKISGFFELTGNFILKSSSSPKILLAIIMASSAILSALFLNDTICIMLTPLISTICIRAKRNPVPYLIALALSANIGSAATIIGNPQNMLIGSSSGIPFFRFLSKMAAPSALGTLAAYCVMLLCFRNEFFYSGKNSNPGAWETLAEENISDTATVIKEQEINYSANIQVNKPLLYKCLFAGLIMVAALLLGISVTLAAMAAASILLITRLIEPEKIFYELDWSILAFFAGLFILTAGISKSDIFAFLLERGILFIGDNIARFSGFTVVLSNLVSNVPAVMLLKPLILLFPDHEKAWLVVAMASTFAGNLTLLGSVANLIVAETAKRYGIKISFSAYLKAGLPVTLLTIIIGTAWLMLI